MSVIFLSQQIIFPRLMSQRHHRGSQSSHAPFILASSYRTPERGCGREAGRKISAHGIIKVVHNERLALRGRRSRGNELFCTSRANRAPWTFRKSSYTRIRMVSTNTHGRCIRSLIRRAVPTGTLQGRFRHEKSVKKPGDLWRSINQTAMAN